jgi:hypothetical protein
MGSKPVTLEKLQEIAEAADVRNGDHLEGEYAVKSFSAQKKIAELKKDSREEFPECSFSYKVGVDYAIKQIGNESFGNDAPTAKRLRELKDSFKVAISREWDGAEGDSEACEINDYWFFTTDGLFVNIQYNVTD